MIATKQHGSIAENIKVHFAGTENVDFARVIHDAGVNYFLFTALAFLKNEFAPNWGSFSCAKNLIAYEELPKMGKHVIMDSGLFTLMFGAGKNIKPDEEFIRKYMQALCDLINDHHIDPNVACVECDCQKLLGTDIAWDLRKQMRLKIQNPIINVFHFEDGLNGLNRLVDFSDYIAISVPELRIVKPKTYREDTYRLACYIKNKKPEIDIHLLGCTEPAMLERCKFCTSSDSTAWQSVNRWGHILQRRTKNIKPEVISSIHDKIKQIIIEFGVEPTEKKIEYYSNYWLSAHLHKYEFARFAGNQD